MAAQIHTILRNLQLWLETGSKLLLLVAILIFALSRTIQAAQPAADIGNISELNGSAQVVRDQPYQAELSFNIQQDDRAVTSNGRMAITFLDDSIVRLTEHSKLVIDEYIFDPNPSNSKMALNFTLGTARFISGSLNKIDKNNIDLKTPTANIAIRGTDFTVTVNEVGSSLIILLPDEFGNSSGEIVVSTGMGQVVLNKPYEATTVDVFEKSPTKPVVLDISLDVIDNMLIVSPPKEEVLVQNEEVIKKADYLDFNDLDIDFLDEDFLDNEQDLEFTELDINYLDVNFLEDLLDILDELDVAEEEDQLSQDAGTVSLTGTKFGQDLDTQITSYVTGEVFTIIRAVNNKARVDLNTSQAYTVIFVQDGVSRTVKVNGGDGSVIRITQSN